MFTLRIKQGYSTSQYHKRKQNKDLEKQHLFTIMFTNNQSYIIRTKLATQMKMQDTEKNRACNEKKFAHKELGLLSNEFRLKMNGTYYTAFAVANKTVNRQVTWRTRRGDTSIPSNL